MSVVMFDIDDTLINNNTIEKVMIKYGCEHAEVKYDYRQMDIPTEAMDEIEMMFNSDEHAGDFLPNEGMEEFVSELVKLGHVPISVTKRPDSVRRSTRGMMNKFFPDIKFIFFGKSEKWPLIEACDVTHVFDDSSSVIMELQEKPVKVFMMSNEMTAHNHEFVKAGGFKVEKIINRIDVKRIIDEYFRARFLVSVDGEVFVITQDSGNQYKNCNGTIFNFPSKPSPREVYKGIEVIKELS